MVNGLLLSIGILVVAVLGLFIWNNRLRLVIRRQRNYLEHLDVRFDSLTTQLWHLESLHRGGEGKPTDEEMEHIRDSLIALLDDLLLMQRKFDAQPRLLP